MSLKLDIILIITSKDFPMKINMSIIGEEDILSNINIGENYSLLRKKSEVYIYPTEMKNLLKESIEKKEKILNKKNIFNDNTEFFSFISFFCFIILFFDVLCFFLEDTTQSTVVRVFDIVGLNSFTLFLVSLLFMAVLDDKYDLNLSGKPIPFTLFLTLTFILSPINALIYMIFFAKEAIREIRKDYNYSEKEMKDIEDLKELLKYLPQSVKNIVLAEKISFY